MTEMTLRELCITLHVSRRAVQGYEKAKLVQATSRNNRGYLLYDEEAQERVQTIRFYQQIGFTIKEITHLIDAASIEKKHALTQQLEVLKLQKKQLEQLIEKAKDHLDKI
ncbi:MerR family transcriptional regulator [Ohessyouella blattaphilus]|uniref:MerR family transcriptional regulator n=1 Tax=Ohessyouella blattaphilus TaxID=2949333 RepID=A0ABT1EIH8_9FIRM|nr:MerR family transcriptional regulator [Ohessyouella blattaphilus]MCP1110488.1 MerR family transcriptional regulator [Ohessyouella blattaphilus]MCR8563882.1 MerR family transcriptional regulator [Ohessyouella blattaphilus]